MYDIDWRLCSMLMIMIDWFLIKYPISLKLWFQFFIHEFS